MYSPITETMCSDHAVLNKVKIIITYAIIICLGKIGPIMSALICQDDVFQRN